jgi:hypothetical protein
MGAPEEAVGLLVVRGVPVQHHRLVVAWVVVRVVVGVVEPLDLPVELEVTVEPEVLASLFWRGMNKYG